MEAELLYPTTKKKTVNNMQYIHSSSTNKKKSVMDFSLPAQKMMNQNLTANSKQAPEQGKSGDP